MEPANDTALQNSQRWEQETSIRIYGQLSRRGFKGLKSSESTAFEPHCRRLLRLGPGGVEVRRRRGR